MHHDIINTVITMNISAIWHEAKSAFSYAYDHETLHLIIRTAKNDWDNVQIIYGDAFDWVGHHKHDIHWRHDTSMMTKRYQTQLFDYYFIAIKPKDLRLKYAFLLQNKNTYYFFGSAGAHKVKQNNSLYDTYDLSDYFNYPFIQPEDDFQTPDWVKDTIWYQIFPDRFCNVDGKSRLPWGKLPVNNYEFYGGTLKGITQKLSYIKSMGFNGIYLTPIFESPSAHRYDTINYYKIDLLLGTEDDFKLLLDQAHALQMKIMIDGVFNHVDYKHPWFLDVVKHGKDSLYKDCFYIDEYPVLNVKTNKDGHPMQSLNMRPRYKTFAYSMRMPKWNTSSKQVQEHLLGAIRYWTKLGVDGWRLDVSNEISHHFLRQIKQVIREENPNVCIIGENMDYAMPWLQGDQMDSVMNYAFVHPVWKYLEHKITLTDFQNRIQEVLAKTPKNILKNMYNLVGTHDQVRIKRRLNDDMKRVKQAFIWMFTSQGCPSVYYGDEIGMTGDHDPDNRRCMIWDEASWDKDFQSLIKRLIELRHMYPALSTADYHFVSDDTLAYLKTNDTSSVLIILNQNKSMTWEVPFNLKGEYLDLLTHKKIAIHDKIALDAYESYMLLRSK